MLWLFSNFSKVGRVANNAPYPPAVNLENTLTLPKKGSRQIVGDGDRTLVYIRRKYTQSQALMRSSTYCSCRTFYLFWHNRVGSCFAVTSKASSRL
ncbi:hypothetical protein [Aliterella atlantica]|uniref:Uncharacterized protein n=1 Tax=Aliterella atlantica CENA595 TaxID=1618023 RepID=A0A0D8ZVG1_9CYAN|nr:hypothetical protein [Aliterella atlantica]KJH72459.1 hypothetical protein UH38_06750 [Aliterella atlantica CENA595]